MKPLEKRILEANLKWLSRNSDRTRPQKLWAKEFAKRRNVKDPKRNEDGQSI